MRKTACLAAVALCIGVSSLEASIILNTAGQQETINGVIFWVPHVDVGNLPSGSIHSFLNLRDVANDADTIQSGFNTTYTPISGLDPAPNDVDYTKNNALRVNDDPLTPDVEGIPRVMVGGIWYRELAYSSQEEDDVINLKALSLAATPTPAVQKFWDLDEFTVIALGTEPWIELHDLYKGTHIDFLMYVPESTGVFDSTYVTMYNYFDGAGDGTDEWGVRDQGDTPNLGTIPEPGSIIVWSVLGLAGILAWRRKAA